ncbi:unnamed protein product [Nippostrongylus brasiliensis]|uniref:EXPERA domain-containing protein n=1 Tax=Nippostrongylus brasiliensis TaxID=27835 RepID=A0A0N4YQC0_NIPBR|nr:unnamed protein product [Nippostrongylus brasiliensis]
MFVALVLFATAHTLFQVTGGPYLFNYDALSYDIYRTWLTQEDKFLRILWNLSYYLLWKLSPFLILFGLFGAFPWPPPTMKKVAFIIVALILLPTPLAAISEITLAVGNQRNVRSILSPEYELWGPRMTDDRKRAEMMEKKVRNYRYLDYF